MNLTFANVLLTLAGNKVKSVMSGDQNAAVDQADIARDIPYVEKNTTGSFSWHWYQNGYDAEPNETGAAAAGHANYVSHHNGAQYFGYISNNSKEQPNLKGENDFFTDIGAKNLPSDGGVFYIRGGYNNILNQKPPIQNPDYPDTMGLTAMEIATIDAAKAGDDDHPSYSDKQLSEAMNARVINAIAHSKYWDESAIILTYDESDGGYDHEPPEILSYGPDKLPLARGVRIPLLLISPYARAGAVSHAEGDHNAIIETINAIFGLPPLSTLPDEAAALKAGDFEHVQRLRAGRVQAEVSRPARHQLRDHRQSALGLQPGPPERNREAVAGFVRGYSRRHRREVPALRWQWLRGDPPHADRQQTPELDPGGFQHAARDAARLQRNHSVNTSP